jgi:hypothetical protein
MAADSEITAPVAKAATALTAGAGTSVISMSHQAASFLPTDLNGWMALTAPLSAALIYSLHLLGEWYWKKVWRPFAERAAGSSRCPARWYGPTPGTGRGVLG